MNYKSKVRYGLLPGIWTRLRLTLGKLRLMQSLFQCFHNEGAGSIFFPLGWNPTPSLACMLDYVVN